MKVLSGTLILNIMKRVLQILNLISLIITIAVNYFVNTGEHVAANMKAISGKYDNLLTPAGYAFSIWGLIYLGLICFAIYQARGIFNKNTDNEFVLHIGPWFIIANILNAAWVLAFTHDLIALSIVIMVFLFIALLKIILNLKMELWDAPLVTIALIWWPFSIYFGWINVAFAANISLYLVSLGFLGGSIGATAWAIIVLLLLSFIVLTMIWTRNMREYGTAAAWGVIAIGVKNLETSDAVSYTAFIAAAVILLNVAIHAYKNRAYSPFRSLRPKA